MDLRVLAAVCRDAAAMTTPYAWIDRALDTLHRAHWYRSVQAIAGKPGPMVTRAGRDCLNFASNDYLGLAGDSRLAAAAIAATREYGTGSTGSRLLSGHRDLHRQLEGDLAALKGTADALVFSSGYLANLGTIAALLGPRDLILADAYNHSSLKAGATLSGATVVEYPHGNLAAVREGLGQRERYRRCAIVTDGVFSMDGDLCPLPALLDLADAWDAMLLVDDAHATGVLGATGAGTTDYFQVERPLVQLGTLSKALGSLGGYVAGPAPVIDFLRNRAPSWVYTTGLSPADTAAARAAIAILRAEPERRQRLWHNVSALERALSDLPMLPSQSPIRCLRLDRPETALDFARELETAGIYAAAIRPPTAPTSRLRLSVMATHTSAHIDALAVCLREGYERYRPSRLPATAPTP